MSRYVLDTNQIIAAGTSWLDGNLPVPDPNASRRLLIHIAKNETGLYCGQMMNEYIKKLIVRNHPADRIGAFVEFLLGAFEQVSIATQNAPHPPTDADDEIFVLCAIDGRAHYLISGDMAVLVLAQHYPAFVICAPQAEVERLGI